MTFVLKCTLCAFQDTVEEVDDVFDIIEAHQEERGEDHFVEFEMVGEEPLLRGGDGNDDFE